MSWVKFILNAQNTTKLITTKDLLYFSAFKENMQYKTIYLQRFWFPLLYIYLTSIRIKNMISMWLISIHLLSRKSYKIFCKTQPISNPMRVIQWFSFVLLNKKFVESMNGYVLFVLDWTEKKVVSKNRILKFKLAKQSLSHCHKEFLN